MTQEIRSPMAATVVEFAVAAGQAVRTGDLLAIVEAMKMEHVHSAPVAGRVSSLAAVMGEQVTAFRVVAEIEKAADAPQT